MATPTTTSAVFPSTAVSTGSGVAWTNPTNALTENATNATSALTKSATTSATLRVTGFDFSSIPSGAIITGIQVRVKRSTAGATVLDNSVRLSLSGAAIGSNLASATNYTTTLVWATYGGDGEMWGTSLTDSQVKDASFGVDFSAKLSGTTSRQVNVDAITIAVSYMPPGVYMEVTDAPDTCGIDISIPVVASIGAVDPADSCGINATAATKNITYVGTGATASYTNNGSGGSTINVPLPTGWAADDILIMQLTMDGSTGSMTIGGWTTFASLGTTLLFWRRAQSSDIDQTIFVSPGLGNTAKACMSAWRDAQADGTPIENAVFANVPVSSGPGGAVGTAPSTTVTSIGSVIISTASASTSGSITFQSPFTTVHQLPNNFSTAASGALIATATGTQSGGTFSANFAGTYPSVSFVIMPGADLSPPPTSVSINATDDPDTANIDVTRIDSTIVNINATDTADTAGVSASVVGSANLAATDVADTATVNVSVRATVSLAATDVADTASINATARTPVSIAVTDAPDTANLSVSVVGTASLAATDVADSAAGSVSITGSVVLAATDVADTASINATNRATVSLAATDVADTASINATNRATVSLAATDAADTANLSASVVGTVSLAATDAPDTCGIVTSIGNAIWIAVTDVPDTANIELYAPTTVWVQATDAPDTSGVNVSVVGTASLAATDVADTASGNVTARTHVNLAATDVADTASINVSARTQVSLAATDVADTPGIVLNVSTTVSLAATDVADTATINASVRGTVSLAATDVADTAGVSASITGTASLAATDGPDTASGSVTARTHVNIGAVDQADTSGINISVRGTASLAATDVADTASGSLAIIALVSLTATDGPDTASINVTAPILKFGEVRSDSTSGTSVKANLRIGASILSSSVSGYAFRARVTYAGKVRPTTVVSAQTVRQYSFWDNNFPQPGTWTPQAGTGTIWTDQSSPSGGWNKKTTTGIWTEQNPTPGTWNPSG